MMNEKSYSTTKKQSNPQRKEDRYDIKSYPQRKEDKYGDPRQYDKSYHQQQKGRYNDSYHQQKAKPAKQEKTRSVYKYKIERDESGNCRYVLEEPIDNPSLLVNYREFVCVYPSNGTKYYKNVNIYNYKKKIII